MALYYRVVATALFATLFVSAFSDTIPSERVADASSASIAISELLIDRNIQSDTGFTVGSPLTLATNITNIDTPSQTFIAIFEIQDSQGVAIFLNFYNGTIGANVQSTVSSEPWIADSPGSFNARTFIISDWVQPEILTNVQTLDFEVSAETTALLPTSEESEQDDGLVDIGNLSLMLPILNTQDPQNDLDIIKKYLKSGDILVDGLNIQNMLVSTKSSVPGLEVAIGGTSIENVPVIIERSAPGVDYIAYDYERDFTPEWSEDPNTSIDYFQQLSDLAHAKGKKFIAVPVYAFGQDWDWGEVASSSNMDILVLQVQNFQTGARVPQEYTPVSLGEDMVGVVQKVISQVQDKSPETKIYLQMDTLVTEDPNDVIRDIELVKDLEVDGLTLWYNPGVSASGSKIGLLEEVLSSLKRNTD